jgi:hypothetical protein
MVFFGPLSSLFDFLTFGVLLGVFHAGPTLFRTGWFIESLATQSWWSSRSGRGGARSGAADPALCSPPLPWPPWPSAWR